MGVLQLPDAIASQIGEFTGRSWVLPSLSRWLNDSTDRYLILTGPPGTGKTALMAWLAGWGPAPAGTRAHVHLKQVRALAAATHFCRADSGNVAPKAFAEAISRQLTASVEGFGEALVATLSSDLVRIQADIQTGEVRPGASVTGVRIGRLDLGNLGDEISFDRAFRTPLKELYESGYTEPMLLLVDGLDESQAYTGTPLLRLLSRLSDLPPQVRFLLTTRPDPRVLAFFRRAHRVDLIDDAPATADDVGRYVARRLRRPIDPAHTRGNAALGRQISAAAKGNFLYARLVLNDLLLRLPDIPEVLRLPKDLSDIYHEFLLREAAPDKALWTDLYRPLLGLLAVAEEPGLTQTQLERMTGKEVEGALRACMQFLSGNLPDGPFLIFHRSFTDFLLEDDANIDYHIDAGRVHRQIADHYWQTDGDWTGVDDYGLRHLAAHLELAGQAGILHELLAQGQRNGEQWENSWYAARGAAGQLDGYMADVERAYRLAANEAAAHLQIRYVLYLSSLRGAAARVPGRLLQLCLQEDVLTWQQALDFVRLHQDPVVRAQALSRIVRSSRFPSEERGKAAGAEYAVAARLDDDEQRGSSFLAVADILPDHLVDDLITRTADIVSGRHQAGIVMELAARLNERQMAATLRIARSVTEPALQVRAMLALAACSGESQLEALLAEIRTVVAEMDPTDTKVAALCELAGLEAERRQETIDQAFTIAGGLDYFGGLASALGALARLGIPALSAERLAQMLELALRTYQEEDRPGIEEAYIAALVALGPLLSEEQRKSYIAPRVANMHGYTNWLGKRVASERIPVLVPYLPRAKRDAFFTEYLRPLIGAAATPEPGPSIISVVIGAMSPSLGSWRRPAALAALAQLPQPLVDAALAIVENRPSGEGNAEVLATLIPRLPSERRAPILRRELGRVRRIGDEPARLRAVAALVPYLPEGMRATLAEEILEASQPLVAREASSQKIVARVGAFDRVCALAPHLPPDRTAAVVNHAIDAALATEDGPHAEALAAIVPVLPVARIPEVLRIAWSLSDRDYIVLARLVPRLPAGQSHNETARILEAVQGVVIAELPEDFVDVLRSIAPHLDDAQVVTALELVGNILHRKLLQADAIGILAPRLRRRELERAMSMARNLKGLARVRAMADLIPLLPESRRPLAVRKARETASRLTRNEERAHALTALAPLLADPHAALAEALQAATAITEGDYRARVLSDLLPHLDSAGRVIALDRMLWSCLGMRIARTIGSTVVRENIDRAFLLERIAEAASVLASMGGQHLAAETTRAIHETVLWWG